jgi:hypothetical protein
MFSTTLGDVVSRLRVTVNGAARQSLIIAFAYPASINNKATCKSVPPFPVNFYWRFYHKWMR